MLSLLLSLVCNSDSDVCHLSRSFFFTCVWLVPFAYFISLSINEFVLPCEFPSYRQEQQAQHMNAVGGKGQKGKGAFKGMADWFGAKKTEVLEQNAPPSWHMQKQY